LEATPSPFGTSNIQHPRRLAILVQLPLFSLLLAVARQLILDLVWLQLVRNQPLRRLEQTIMQIKTQRSNPVDFPPKDDSSKVITVNTLTICRVREKLTTRKCYRNSHAINTATASQGFGGGFNGPKSSDFGSNRPW
jgi:hypothetical protein